jgi:FtsP/CotA-like multicopper oxidase with cupredoxin domain
MRHALPSVLLAAAFHALVLGPVSPPEQIVINDNRAPAGVLRNGVLTIRLEAREGEWHPEADSSAGITVRAFAEKGKRLLVPGPLIRVLEGTEIRAYVTNTFARGTLVVHGLSRRGVETNSGDTMQIAPLATRDVRFIAGAPGTYYYWATVDGDTRAAGDSSARDAELVGAFVIDPANAPRPRDRILVLSLWTKGPLVIGTVNRTALLRFTINGKSWPHTERLTYDHGDTVRFRVINTSIVPHPMHLHGFYFTVDSRGDGTVDSVYDRAAAPYRVVTERVAPGRTISMTWVPERAGNWMFHCHDNYHVLRNQPLDGTHLPPEHLLRATNHAHEMMAGLVMGIEVRGPATSSVTQAGVVRRALRLVARIDTSGHRTDDEPAYGYALQGPAGSASSGSALPGPVILLKRGEPVSITVVNHLAEPTSVHWHGIELESYFDGVADLSGSAHHIAPAIAPGDSFEARFTPPRSGTFIYHPHADETRQQQAGLSGALLVVDDPAAYDPAHDIVLLLSVPRSRVDFATILLNGSNTPKPLDLHVGEHYRLRIVDIHIYRPSMIVRFFRDSSLVSWRPVAKDGMPIPPERARPRPAQQQMGNGETYDYDFVPAATGDLRFTVWSAAGDLLVTMPVRVH